MSSVKKEKNFEIFEMSKTDIGQVFSIEKENFNFPWSQNIFNDCIDNGYICKIICNDEKIVGYSISSAFSLEFHIMNISIMKQFQNHGLARMMIQDSYINALKNNCNVIFLECRPSNKIAIHLYESEGFSEVGIRKDYYPSQNGKEDGIIFAKQIFNK